MLPPPTFPREAMRSVVRGPMDVPISWLVGTWNRGKVHESCRSLQQHLFPWKSLPLPSAQLSNKLNCTEVSTFQHHLFFLPIPRLMVMRSWGNLGQRDSQAWLCWSGSCRGQECGWCNGPLGGWSSLLCACCLVTCRGPSVRTTRACYWLSAGICWQ